MTELREQLQSSLSGSYTIDQELGGGGMSRVFVAEETRLGRKVVVKVLSPELAASLSTERFEREIRLAASLQQANIVPVLTAGETDGLPYYTMPYVDGQSLRARLSNGAPALPMDEAISVLRDVARALAYAHDRGIVHRDIKPDNVLMSGGAAVVTDFGIAKAIAAARTNSGSATLTQVGTSIGTPAYMAPEQAAGDDVDHRADLYSLGCMAYELLTGRVPFHGRTPQRMLAAHMSESPQPVSELRTDVPPRLASLLARLLEKDPAMRPQSASEVLQELAVVSTSAVSGVTPAVLLTPRIPLARALAIYVAPSQPWLSFLAPPSLPSDSRTGSSPRRSS
jgi:eukaryotic-like serine/threonine-protein kinase